MQNFIRTLSQQIFGNQQTDSFCLIRFAREFSPIKDTAIGITD